MTLSVIVPVYNTEKYLRRCLDSILAQTRLPDEIICVNDGSTDGSGEILEEYDLSFDMVKIITQANKGRIQARLKGVKIATSQYIMFVDDDDFIEQDMIESLMTPLFNDDIDIVTSGFVRDYGTNIIIETEGIEPGIYKNELFEKEILSNLISNEKFFKYNILASVCTKLFKRDILIKVMEKLPKNLTIGEDDAVVYSYLFEARSICISGKAQYHYCIRNDSTSATLDRKNGKQLSTLMDYMKKLFSENENRTENLLVQFDLFKLFMELFNNPKSVLKYDNGFLYPYGATKKTEKLLLYGTGSLCGDIKEWLLESGFTIAGIADRNGDGENIYRPCDLKKIDYDKILITAINGDVVESITNSLLEFGIEPEKILRMGK